MLCEDLERFKFKITKIQCFLSTKSSVKLVTFRISEKYLHVICVSIYCTLKLFVLICVICCFSSFGSIYLNSNKD